MVDRPTIMISSAYGSPIRSLSATPRETWGNLGETKGWVGELACWSTKAAISPKRVKIVEELLWARGQQVARRTYKCIGLYGMKFSSSEPTKYGNICFPVFEGMGANDSQTFGECVE